MAVTSPLLETTIAGASHVIINVSGDISLIEANEAATYVQDLAGEDANIIFGARYDETYPEECTITVIATGLDGASDSPAGGMRMGRPASAYTSARPISQRPVSQSQPVRSSVTPIQKTVESRTESQSLKIPEFLQKHR